MSRLVQRPTHTDLVAKLGNFRRLLNNNKCHSGALFTGFLRFFALHSLSQPQSSFITLCSPSPTWPTTEPSSHILSVRSTLYSELSDYGHHSQFAVHHPDFTFESGVYVRPVIYRGSDNVYGDSFYCVYLWGRTVTDFSIPPDLCTYDQIR